jgi:hypothetical protein
VTFTVVSPAVLVTVGRRQMTVTRGRVLPDGVDPATVTRLLAEGLIRADAEAEVVPVPTDADAEAEVVPRRPGRPPKAR